MDNKTENKIEASAKENPEAVIEEPDKTTTTAPTAITTNDSKEDIVLNNPPPKTTSKKKNKAKARNLDLEMELKKLTQRRINVAGAPKMPLNAYVRFMNDRREQLRREQPNRTALEHTKIIGEEWHLLTEEVKAPYMASAANDKALYQEQMHKFLKEHPEIVATELAKAKKTFDSKNASTPKEKATANSSISNTNNNNSTSNNNEVVSKKTNVKPTVSKQQSTPTPDPDDIPLSQVKRTPTPPAFSSCNLPRPFAAGEIPIYTTEFIEHNRSTENELRMLRKAKTDLEQQNAVLEQHVDNTKAGHAKVMGEVGELKEENARLAAYIKNLKQKIVGSLGGIALPPVHPSGVNVDNVDKYIQHLAGMISSSAAGDAQNNAMLLKVGDVLCKMDTTSLQKPTTT